MIKKTKRGYGVVSKTGKNLGRYQPTGQAAKRLAQVEYFKKSKRKAR